ncbi:hypothetical protein SBA2_530007 [Acidobacteriia bacterium SbA2]|nr:hypothetical protein SBA2_530007 [Acidobacteriia bacterium SbA2]
MGRSGYPRAKSQILSSGDVVPWPTGRKLLRQSHSPHGPAFGLGSWLHGYWVPFVRSNGLLAEVQPLTPRHLGTYRTCARTLGCIVGLPLLCPWRWRSRTHRAGRPLYGQVPGTAPPRSKVNGRRQGSNFTLPRRSD